jgi:hypothetical protein
VIYGLLMKAAAETTLQIAADPRRLGARIGITAVLHTWGSAMIHHPHVHMIVPGGGLSDDGSTWISAKPDFLVHVHVLSALFRGKFLGLLTDAHAAGRLQFHGHLAGLADKKPFKRFLGPLRHVTWVVYCKEPFGGPEQVLRSPARSTAPADVTPSDKRCDAAGDHPRSRAGSRPTGARGVARLARSLGYALRPAPGGSPRGSAIRCPIHV